jgi:hypothetical protein
MKHSSEKHARLIGMVWSHDGRYSAHGFQSTRDQREADGAVDDCVRYGYPRSEH